MKKLISVILAVVLLTSSSSAIEPVSEEAISISAPSAILIERSTGEVIYEKNAYEHLSPASATKVMTMLLIVEAVDSGSLSLDDMVTASSRAASMGGSQIWLEEGEQMTVGEMLKCVAVVSANDCCVALAEHLSGSEEAFVARMNERAAQLGMNDTHFTCCSGLLESDEHYTCARDIAVMSRELLSHETIRQYTGIWMDSIRAGEFTLANTNKLIYYYKGATGLKTGFTQKAMYCLSASAMRDGVEFIAVVLHAPTSPDRFDSAKTLLNFAFANYTLADPSGSGAIPPVEIELGQSGSVQPVMPSGSGFLMEKSFSGGLSYEINLPDKIKAPVSEGQVLGSMRAVSGGNVLSEIPLIASCNVERVTLWQIFMKLLSVMVGAE